MLIAIVTAIAAVAPDTPRWQRLQDLIYYNAKVVTVDDSFSYAQAVAIAGDKFTAVGTNETCGSWPDRRRGRSISRA